MADETARACEPLRTLPACCASQLYGRIVLVKKHVAEVCAANADRIFEHGVKYWL